MTGAGARDRDLIARGAEVRLVHGDGKPDLLSTLAADSRVVLSAVQMRRLSGA